ncbi:MAG: hypothetical protein HUJ60_06855, partial [Bacilli bacterium]|nr:hypothetical protein [Bacilli bacterium]
MFSRILRYAALFTVVIMVLNLCGVFKIDWVIYPVLGGSMLVMLLPTLFYDFLHYDSPFLHYLFLTVLSLMSGVLYAFLSYHVIIMIVFPVVVSCLYYEKRSVIFVAAVQVPIIVASHLIAFVLKVVPDEPLVTLKGVLLYGVLPRLVEYI